jgi:hypothetical protein
VQMVHQCCPAFKPLLSSGLNHGRRVEGGVPLTDTVSSRAAAADTNMCFVGNMPPP